MSKPNFEIIKLEFPIKAADRIIEEVTMHRPTMGVVRKHPVSGPGDVEGEMKQIGAICDLRLEEMDLMDSADYGRLTDIYLRFRTTTE